MLNWKGLQNGGVLVLVGKREVENLLRCIVTYFVCHTNDSKCRMHLSIPQSPRTCVHFISLSPLFWMECRRGLCLSSFLRSEVQIRHSLLFFPSLTSSSSPVLHVWLPRAAGWWKQPMSGTEYYRTNYLLRTTHRLPVTGCFHHPKYRTPIQFNYKMSSTFTLFKMVQLGRHRLRQPHG